MPYMNVLFGEMMDELNDDGSGFQKSVNRIAILFGYVSAVIFVTAAVKVYCCSAFGERHAQRIRERYVEAIMRQEVGWFDTEGAAELSTRVADKCGKVNC